MKSSSSPSWGTWCLLLCKRHGKTLGFWVVMSLIVVVTALFMLCSREDSGFIRVAVAACSPEDQASVDVIERLKEEREILHITVCETKNEALYMLEQQEADVVWLLRDRLSERILRYANGEKEPLADVFAAEESAHIRAADDVLFSALYPSLSYALYGQYTKDTLKVTDDALLRTTYDTVFRDETLFVYANADTEVVSQSSYITAPLRGLLMTLLLLCACATTRIHLQDEQKGRFWHLSSVGRTGICLLCSTFTTGVASVFVTVALIVVGQYTDPIIETGIMLLSVLAAAGFAALLGVLCKQETRFSVLIPIVLLMALVCCPVFFHVKTLDVVGCLFMPYYALYAVADVRYIGLLIGYSVTIYAIVFGIAFVRQYYKNRGV